VDEFGLWDQERDSYLSALFGDDGVNLLEAADVSFIRVRSDGKGEVVHVGEHDSSWDCHMQ